MKAKIIDFLKLFVMTFAMIQGFFYTYCFILFRLGCTVWWVTILCYVAAFISQWFFFKWVGV